VGSGMWHDRVCDASSPCLVDLAIASVRAGVSARTVGVGVRRRVTEDGRRVCRGNGRKKKKMAAEVDGVPRDVCQRRKEEGGRLGTETRDAGVMSVAASYEERVVRS